MLMIVGLAPARVGAQQETAIAAGIPSAPLVPPRNLERVNTLHQQRVAKQTKGDYVIGEGDVLSLRAFDFEEMNQRVRVDGNGAITLPLLNSVQVAGRTVAQVQDDLTRRLGAYMFSPHITVFVDEYRSQQVAVLGAVMRPGLVSQSGDSSTVRDAISSAGGMTTDAGSRIYLIPAEARGTGDVQTVAAGLRQGDANADSLGHGIMVDTNEADPAAQQAFFSMPVHGGDVIVVPSSGHFVVDGWVAKPGTYPLRAGLTLRGALATAGGLSFPASQRVRIHAPATNGNTPLREVNYADVLAQRTPDVFIHQGDVIQVASSPFKLVPYAFYKVVVDLVKVGAGIKVVP